MNLITKSYSYIKWYAIMVLAISWIGGAAMALEPAVTHQSIGITAWTLSYVFIFMWVVSFVTGNYVGSYKTWKESEKGKAVLGTIILALATIMLAIIATSLGLH